jgi:hypothetical protein
LLPDLQLQHTLSSGGRAGDEHRPEAWINQGADRARPAERENQPSLAIHPNSAC